MAEDDYGMIPYEDVSELKNKLGSMASRKDVSTKDMFEAVHQLAGTMHDMLEIFSAAAEQLKVEEKEYDAESKKHDVIVSKLDKLIDQNKTIAEGMVAIVEMFKEKFGGTKKSDDQPMFDSSDSEPVFVKSEPAPQKQETVSFSRQQPQWNPQQQWKAPEQMRQASPQMQQMASSGPVPAPDFSQMPPMEPTPMPDLDMPDEPFPMESESKRKGMFAMFKK